MMSFTQMERVRESVANNSVSKLCFSSNLYTWDNKRKRDEIVYVHVDRGPCNDEFVHSL